MRLGIILAIILPLLVSILIYYSRFSDYTPGAFLDVLVQENRLITFFGVWIMVANIALLTFYINTNRMKTAKGIFVVTLVLGVIVLLMKLFN
jgi:hypothetical protein